MLCNKLNCTGCASCAASCPVNAVTMTQDQDGFYFPEISDKCIKCGRCKQACPILSPKDRPDRIYPIAYVMKHSNHKTLLQSSSGGMFSVASEFVFKNNGCVFGASWDDDLHVHLTKAENLHELAPMRGSKYLYSHAENAYKQAKQELDLGRTVLFTGVPCQINGLYGYLNKEYENLYTIEIACHGAGSELIFDEYKTFSENKAGKTLCNISHAGKTKPWTKLIRRYAETTWDDGSVTLKDYMDDSYLAYYMKNVCLNEACFNCQFATPQRKADITMCDLMGYGVTASHKLSPKDGVSAVWCNTQKGLYFVKCLQNEQTSKWELCALKECMIFNHTLWKPTPRPKGRDHFFENYHALGYSKMVEQSFEKNTTYRIISVLKKVILRLFGAHLVAYGMYLNNRRKGIDKQVDYAISTLDSRLEFNNE